MKGMLCMALMLIGTRPVQAQVVPLLVDGAQVRVAKRGICIWWSGRCGRWPRWDGGIDRLR